MLAQLKGVNQLINTASLAGDRSGRALKILFVSDVYFPRVNGVSTSIKTFVDQLQQLGHTVHLIAPDYGSENNADIATDRKWVKRVPARKIFFDPEDYLMRYSQAMRLVPELIEEGYDIVHVNTPFVAHYLGIKLAKKLNIPCVETYHTFFEDYLHHYLPWLPQGVARYLARGISKRQCNAVDAIISPSQPMLDVLKTYGVSVSAKVIPTGLQDASFNKIENIDFRAKYGIDENCPMLLYVGRVAFEKNIEFLLGVVHALKETIPNLLLVITGEGPAVNHLAKLAKKLNVEENVRFIGYLDRHTELNACYEAADIFTFASTSETQGLVLLEAMAQATPVVAVAELGTTSILVEGQGAIIAKEDTVDFADKVQDLLSDAVKREMLGEQAIKYVQEQWTAKRQAQRMLRFYQEVISDFDESHADLEAVQIKV